MAIVVGLLALTAAARAASGTPVDFAVLLQAPSTIGAGEPFTVGATIGLNLDVEEGTPLALTWSADIPTGLKLIHAGWFGPVPGPSCVTDCPFDFHGAVAAEYDYQLVAAAPGDYAVTVRTTSTDPADANPANNTGTANVKVVPLRIQITSLAASPAAPRAGKPFTLSASSRSAISGQAIRPDHVSCSARLGSKPLTGAATVTTGKISCRWRIPPTAAGRPFTANVRASLALATASLTRSFHTR